MPARLFEEVDNWANGVITSAPSDRLPDFASPRARNTVFASLAQGVANIGSRLGALTLNSTPVTGSPGIIGGFQFRKKSGNKQTLLVSDTGRLDQLNGDGSLTTINASAFTSGTHYPIFAVANDLCFIVNDSDQKKTDGTTVYKFGITRPAAPTAAAAAAGSSPTGIWDVAISYYNSNTGNESSLSDFTQVTLSAGNQKINVSWPAPADAQVTHVIVYIRQENAGANVYRVVAGATPAPDVTTGGFPIATLSTVLDIASATYSAFIILAPTTSENNPPPAGTQYPVFHAQRMFLFDTGYAYYSNVKNNTSFPEAFNTDNVQPINPNDGDVIVGAASFAGNLYIFKRFSIYKLIGTDPGSWVVSLVTKDFGLSTMRSLVTAHGHLYFWAGHLGPCVMGPDESIISLGKQFISDSIAGTVLNETALTSVSGGLDEENQTVVWAVPEFGGTRNTRLIPFNYQLGRFPAEYWNPFDVYSLWAMETSDRLHALYMGNYAGQAFQWGAATNDGVPGSTTTAGSVTSATSTTLTDSTAAFATTGGALKERYVYAISQDGSTIQRRRITANTATQLTVTPAWDTTPNTTYTYVVGAIDFQIDTAWNVKPGFYKKRFEFMLIEMESDATNVPVYVDLFTSMNLDQPKKTKKLTIGGTGGTYDAATSLYDTTRFAAGQVTYRNLRCGTVGKSWRMRVRACGVAQAITLRRLGMQSVQMGIKT